MEIIKLIEIIEKIKIEGYWGLWKKSDNEENGEICLLNTL